MRTRTYILSGALLLGSSGLAAAQTSATQTTAPQAPPAADETAPFTPRFGQFDFGFRGTTVDGDEARYNRQRDLRTGPLFDRVRFAREEPEWIFLAAADNVGFRDQRYAADYERVGRFRAAVEWDQVPLFLATDQQTLYRETGDGTMDVADTVQQRIQDATSAGTPARNAAIATALAQAGTTDLRSRRGTANVALTYRVNRDVDVHFNLKNSSRSGDQVYAFGFGTNPGLVPAVEFGAPLDDRATDISGAVEYANERGLLRLGYDASWYDNGVPLIRFDNPLRVTDIPGGASIGQAAWWPTNSAFSVNASAAYSLARRTRATAGLSIGRWNQDEPLPPMTVNTALVSPPLPRTTADARANIVSLVLNVNSRPVSNVWLNAKYRLYDYDNASEHFSIDNAVIGDWSITDQHHETEPSSFRRNTIELDASYAPLDFLSVGVGFNHEGGDRTFRIFEETSENGFRVTADSTGNQYFSLRTRYEYSTREGSGFQEHLLEEVGEQPGMRHFDIANRTRSRAVAMLSVFPAGWLTVNGSLSLGDDDYDDTGFGLRDNSNNGYGIGFDVTPNEVVSAGFSYGYEQYKAHQYSRTANPPSPTNQTFFDPTRDWWLDQDDTVHTLTANLDLIKPLPNTDIRFGFDRSDGEATYVYGLKPEQQVFTTTPLQQLRPVKNTLNALRADVQHFLRRNIAVGLAYWFESYRVEDFSLDEMTINRLDPVSQANGQFANTIYAGYIYRPYTAHATWLRMTYLW